MQHESVWTASSSPPSILIRFFLPEVAEYNFYSFYICGAIMPNNLKQKITLIGATGLIVTHFLEEILQDDFQNVKATKRRKIPKLENKDFIIHF